MRHGQSIEQKRAGGHWRLLMILLLGAAVVGWFASRNEQVEEQDGLTGATFEALGQVAWRASGGRGALMGGNRPTAISADGRVVIGHALLPSGTAVFRWSPSMGLEIIHRADASQDEVPLLPSVTEIRATAVSADGSVVVGTRVIEGRSRAFRWTADIGLSDLPSMATWEGGTYATDVSADGQVIVGYARDQEQAFALSWRVDPEEDRPHRLIVSQSSSEHLIPRGIASDGQTITGQAGGTGSPHLFVSQLGGGLQWHDPLPQGALRMDLGALSADGRTAVGIYTTSQGRHPFLWSPELGLSEIGVGPARTWTGNLTDISADGKVVVGYRTRANGDGACLWRAGSGYVWLRDCLGPAGQAQARGWRLTAAVAVSDDGRTVAGYGINPQGRIESWIIRLPAG